MAKALIAAAVAAAASINASSAAPVSLSEASGNYTIAPESSSIRFSVNQITGGGFDGAFSNFSGGISIDGSSVGRSRVDIVILPESVSTGQGRIDAFLRSGAVFDTAHEKRIVFHSTSVRRTDEMSAVVTGKLTARGRTATETFNVRLTDFGRGRIVFKVTGKVKRSSYGMDVGTPLYANFVNFDMDFSARRH